MAYRVLIADDEAPIRKIIARVCQDLGWEADVAVDGNEALELMQHRPHDVFVFDLKMPGPSGLDLARRVSEYEEAPAVLIVTGYPEVGTAVEAMKEGVLDYVQKPINIDNLRSLLVHAAQYHDGYLRSLKARREREETVRNIEEANERFRAMLELSHDAVFLLNARSGEVIDCNATACEQLGWTREELLHMSLMDVEDLPPFPDWESLATRIRDAQSLVLEGMQRPRSDMRLPVELSLSFVYLTSGDYVTAVVRDITERKRAEKALEQARFTATTEAAKLRSMIEGMEEGVVFVDESGMVTEINDWFLEVVRMPREMVLGASIWELHSEEIVRGLRPIVEDFRSGIRGEKIIVNRDFMGRPASIRIQPVFHDNTYRGLILNVIDVADLVEAREKAEEASRSKSESLAQMSFEMRTQLEGIRGMTSALLDTDLTEEQRLLIETAEECAVSLNSLVNDIQEISAIERQALDIEPSDFNLQAVVQEASEAVRGEIEKGETELVCRFDEGLPMPLRGHGDHLAHALTILLEDALRLFKGRKMFLDLRQAERVDKRIDLLIAASGSGDVEDGTVERRPYPGVDIRVSLLKSLIEMLDGVAWVEMTDERFCRLCFTVSVEARPTRGEIADM